MQTSKGSMAAIQYTLLSNRIVILLFDQRERLTNKYRDPL
jgi:hypothetical protein